MTIDALRQAVMQANQELARRGLARFTFGNASAIDRHKGIIVIKPSGVPYDALTPSGMVITDLDGNVLEDAFRPSSDLATHVALYRAFPSIGGVVHTHSRYATSWAQAGRDIPCFGTTHADHFHGAIPVTAPMSEPAIANQYEANTGAAIVERFRALDAATMPAALVHGHAPFCWGRTVEEAVEHADLLEEVARLAYQTMMIDSGATEISAALRDKHFLRKHGSDRYYGQ
ncbi:MAG TPA: L-ribulose-5-phosphate 4-epimerase AraD [Gemmatimonadales bacterium]|jgi:L-ribulose-5-phosphate 4-epimerase